ncbi:FAD-dependent oxidoreductase [Sulfolobus sp. A20]|uniref:NAD(P)/FAD-dependent oxidoreductase n=1 Tax=Sulfolobaceae TaxID=118883 RepID=UPI0008460FAD|nr:MULTISPECIES: FAD-binding oxidoreductase [unclassified Sulfolobus]TRM78006.1 FAD-binding oxidoreductase [Sulfolobus sp. B5]TRM82526.1 FAD-binding oxidoreductase [Sulfolobus sp. D5]TRM83038.1 FAD-binding oxidoreductase [Sulfolobus sp. A20-N-F6]TRM87862.1 FAD-binding oxidoreductase [Sulfolobus sp. C3]TRM93495.1 FAD-binding oxidoreductase [Sulfolobus sp. A20-N-G8]TRN01832.1 FAD-binding oxidoreductase [Sulfolobus sp. E1]
MTFLIVGAGSHGLSLAYHLVKKGFNKNDIYIVEWKRIGYGSSSRNASRYRYHFYSKENVEYAIDAINYLKRHSKELVYNPLLVRTGYLWLIKNESLYEQFKKLDAIWKGYHIGGKFIECEKYRFIKFDGICYLAPQDGSFHHDYILYSYYYSIKNSVNFIYDKISLIQINNGKVKGVRLSNGKEIHVDNVIITAGAWSSELLSTVGISLPIYPELKEIYITEPLRYLIEPLVIDPENQIYFSQTLKGEIIGGLEDKREYGFHEFTVSLKNTIKYLRSLKEIVYGIEGIGILRGWSGYYEMTPDSSHIMGFSNHWPEGLYIDAGYSGHGMMFAPFSGKIMAEFLADNVKNKYLDIFSPERFNLHRLINENLVI